jgi:uncharacterized protein HemX
MRTFTRFLWFCTLAVALALPAVTLAYPQRRDEPKQKQRDSKKDDARKAPAESKGSERIEQLRSRMKARDKEIDRIMNKDKKR